MQIPLFNIVPGGQTHAALFGRVQESDTVGLSHVGWHISVASHVNTIPDPTGHVTAVSDTICHLTKSYIQAIQTYY